MIAGGDQSGSSHEARACSSLLQYSARMKTERLFPIDAQLKKKTVQK